MAVDEYTAEALEAFGMADLREAGATLGLTFGPSTSKVQAREEILAAQTAAAVEAFEAENPDVPEADLEPDTGEDPDVADVPAEPIAESVEVTVRPNGAWVCPITDHANYHTLTACGRCKAPLEDGRVDCQATS